MTAQERIAAFLRSRPGKQYCDDCLSEALDIRPRQQVQQKTSQINKWPFFDRRFGQCDGRCKSLKLVATYGIPPKVVEIASRMQI
jgi:hypothetical protein